MHKRRHRLPFTFCALLALGSVHGLLGCSAQPKPVNQVQPNLVDKKIFEGEWWYSSTAIDVSYDEAFVFSSESAMAPYTGSMSTDYGLDYNRGGTSVLGEPQYSFPIARIRWVIDEHYLFAYRAFELVAGGNTDAQSPDFLGQPLAVFKIEAHADVRKSYDDITGETTNVTQENSSDQHWQDRKLMRVDWSQNLLTQFVANDVQANELFTSFKHEPAPFFVQAGSHPELPASYQPQFVKVSEDPGYARHAEWPSDAGDTVHYMSFVTQEVWSPGSSCLTQPGAVCSSVTATMRNSFLRVPPGHEYAAQTETNREFDHFGLFRSNQTTYAGGGQDIASQHKHCTQDSDCGDGGACDNAARREKQCVASGHPTTCRKEQDICVGGLTADQGETDFLSFFVSRHNLYADSLSDQRCVEDWECDSRYGSCGAQKTAADGCTAHKPAAQCKTQSQVLDACLAVQGSVCDPAAHRCTIAPRSRPTRAVAYRLSPHFPPYLVRRAFDTVAQWNEALMRGERAVRGSLPIDQKSCDNDRSKVCTADLAKQGRVACQKSDPTAFCYCGSPDASAGTCRRDYEPFESPKAAKARGVPNPYDCYVEGPADIAHPTQYGDYRPAQAYAYHFRGSECLLTLEVNSCDDGGGAACEEIGDLRQHFLVHIQHGGAPFAGVTQPLSDPKNGELIVSNAIVAAESLENVGTMASQLFPVLRGEVPEDRYFTAENVRGYFARLGKVEHPVTAVAVSSAGNELRDSSRPKLQQVDAWKDLLARMNRLQPKLAKLKGQDGRAAILSGRKTDLVGSPTDQQLSAALAAEAEFPAQSSAANTTPVSGLSALDAPQKQLEAERQRRLAMASRNMDVVDDALYNSQYYRYYADAFKGRPLAEASLRMQQAYFEAIALHEMGHAMGLRHNFAGSLDRNQYHDAYFALATSTPLPSYLDYDDPQLGGNGDGDVTGEEAQRFGRDLRAARDERLQAGAGNVMSSSVMDYNGDLSDYSGLGRYDRAAAAFSYFSRIEAYTTGTPTQDPAVASNASLPLSLQGLERPDLHRRELWTYYRGGESCQTDSDCPQHAGRDTTAFQPVAQRCVGNPRLPGVVAHCENPGGCLCSSFYDDFSAYSAGTAYRRSTETAKYAPVNYLYCHDNRATDLSWCTTFDAGESFQEVVEHYRRSFRERYPRAYFRNYRAAGPSKGAAYPNVVDAVKIYQHMFFRQSYEGAAYRRSLAPLGMYDQLFASAATLDWLGEIIGAPDVGSYDFDALDNVYRHISPDPAASGTDLQLGLGQGYYLWSEYQTGQNGYFRLDRAGTFLDKLLAIQAIGKRDWGLTYQVDEFFYVNFFDYFQQEVVDMFGGLIMRDPRAYAPRLTVAADGSHQLSYLSTFRGFNGTRANQDTTYPQPAIDGSDTEVLRDIATIEALSNFPVFYDTSFEQRLLVFKLGSGDGYTIPDKRPDGTATCGYGQAGCAKPDYIVFESDRLHTSYVAVTIDPTGSGTLDEQQVGYQLLRRLYDRQTRIRDLSALPKSADTDAQLTQLRADLERDESFLEYLIELERKLGISSYFF
ncbi:MAG TPA: zinc-dependent metalloprotease [Polyangiales bacterium]